MEVGETSDVGISTRREKEPRFDPGGPKVPRNGHEYQGMQKRAVLVLYCPGRVHCVCAQMPG